MLKLGGSTVISLPSAWTRNRHLSKGSLVELSVAGESLVVRVPGASGKKEIAVDASQFEYSDYYSVMMHAYLSGAEQVALSGLRIKNLHLENWPGFEVTSQKKDKTLVRFLGPGEPFASSFQRLVSMLKTLAGDCTYALEKRDSEALESFSERKRSLQRATDLAVRSLQLSGADPEYSFSHLLQVVFLEIAWQNVLQSCESLGKAHEKNERVRAALKYNCETMLECLEKPNTARARENLEKVRKLCAGVGVCELKVSLEEAARNLFLAVSTRFGSTQSGVKT